MFKNGKKNITWAYVLNNHKKDTLTFYVQSIFKIITCISKLFYAQFLQVYISTLASQYPCGGRSQGNTLKYIFKLRYCKGMI